MGITAVWGPPRSAKTTLSIDLAFALSQKGKSVCLISPESYSELSVLLGVQIIQEKSLLAAPRNLDFLKQIVHKVDDLLYVLAMPFDNDAFGDDLSVESAHALLNKAKTLFDVVIVDCPSHTGSALAAWALSESDQVLLLSGACSSAVLWHHSFHKALSVLRSKSLLISDEVNATFDYRTLHSMLEIVPDVSLPYFANADMVQSVKRTLYHSNGKTGKSYSKAIDTICTLISRKEENKKCPSQTTSTFPFWKRRKEKGPK